MARAKFFSSPLASCRLHFLLIRVFLAISGNICGAPPLLLSVLFRAIFLYIQPEFLSHLSDWNPPKVVQSGRTLSAFVRYFACSSAIASGISAFSGTPGRFRYSAATPVHRKEMTQAPMVRASNRLNLPVYPIEHDHPLPSHYHDLPIIYIRRFQYRLGYSFSTDAPLFEYSAGTTSRILIAICILNPQIGRPESASSIRTYTQPGDFP